MSELNRIDKDVLAAVADLHEIPEGAYNIRKNGETFSRRSVENIEILPKKDKPGIDIYIKDGTKNQSLHIPVILTETGLHDLVYNDFYIGDDCDVLIVAGCGIHNCGDQESSHSGIHAFHIGKRSHVKYVEKHYGAGEGTGARILNPETRVDQEEDSICEMETVQIRGVSSANRNTHANLAKGAKLIVTERLMTHENQTVESNVQINLNGNGAIAQVVSRSIAKDASNQVFHPVVIGNAPCRAHVQCDSIIMGGAKIRSIPEICANDGDAQLIHEAAIGKINGDQIVKLMTFGLTEEQAEEIIVEGFLH